MQPIVAVITGTTSPVHQGGWVTGQTVENIQTLFKEHISLNHFYLNTKKFNSLTAAAAKSLQLCPTL